MPIVIAIEGITARMGSVCSIVKRGSFPITTRRMSPPMFGRGRGSRLSCFVVFIARCKSLEAQRRNTSAAQSPPVLWHRRWSGSGQPSHQLKGGCGSGGGGGSRIQSPFMSKCPGPGSIGRGGGGDSFRLSSASNSSRSLSTSVLFQRIWHKTRVGLSNGLLVGQWQRRLPKL